MNKQFFGAAMLVAAGLSATWGAFAASSADKPAWNFAGGDVRNTRNNENEHILTTENISKLAPLWSTTIKGGVRVATPTTDGLSIYLGSNTGILYRVDRKSGDIVWQVDLPTVLDIAGASSKVSITVADDSVILGLQNKPIVAAFAKKDGALLWKQTIDDHPGALVTQSSIVVGDKLFVGVSGLGEEIAAGDPKYPCCTFRGSEMALDLHSGKILWKTYTIPKGYAGASIWSSTPAYDPKRKTLFVTTGNTFSLPPEVVKCADANKDNMKELAKCTPPGVWFDSILALNPDTGAIKWGRRFAEYDVYTQGCLFSKEEGGTPENCQGGGHNGKGDYDFGHAFSGDYDFSSGAMLWHLDSAHGGKDVVGAGQKSGTFWALDRDTGKIVWQSRIGPGGPGGGMEMGSAIDGKRAYVAESNAKQPGHRPEEYALMNGQKVKYGSFAALDASTGKMLWQIPDPAGQKFPGTDNLCTSKGDRNDCTGAYARGPVSSANGIMFACSLEPEGHMYAFDGATGKVLWTFQSGSSCDSGAAIIDGTVYWVGGNKLHAFGVKPEKTSLNDVRNGTSGASGKPGITYTAAQADEGKKVFIASCARGCHLENMGGSGPAPALAGNDFMVRWEGSSLGKLYQKISTTMPKSAPGSLDTSDYLNVTAFILASNGFPAGKDEIKDNVAVLNDIDIEKN